MQTKSPVCILCRSPFNATDRHPCTQVCHHSICIKCIVESDGSVERCPQDEMKITLSKQVNCPLLRYLSESNVVISIPKDTKFMNSATDKISHYLEGFADILKLDLQYHEIKPRISPQLRRRLVHLLESTHIFVESRVEFVNRVSSVFKRLLIELIQAHFNTKQREEEFRRLVKKKGCILHPELTNHVMKILIKLYNGSGQSNTTSFERNVLIKFCLKELPGIHYTKKQVEKVIQTLFFSSCFHVTKGDNQPSRYRLKDELYDIEELRLQYDLKLIKLAQEGHIRLSPESWAHLLYERSYPEDKSRLQSLLDKHQATPTYCELKNSITRAGDRCILPPGCLSNLYKIESMISKCRTSLASDISLETLEEIIRLLYQERRLFTLRQCRSASPPQPFI